MPHPELIVFDLDFTLWDCNGTWCDCLRPPFCVEDNDVIDGSGRWIRLYADVANILDDCDAESIPMALASRTEQPAWARELIDLLGVAHRFEIAEIYPTSKLKHFAALQQVSGIRSDRMLFFDDEIRNIREVSTLGTTCIHVENGLTRDEFQHGLQQFQQHYTGNSMVQPVEGWLRSSAASPQMQLSPRQNDACLSILND